MRKENTKPVINQSQPKKKAPKALRVIATIALVFAALVFIIVFLSTKDNTSHESAPKPVEATETVKILLGSNDAGEYGREIVLNEGTENEYRFYGFYIPAGEYKASYNANGACQITICTDGISVRDDGIEEIIVSEQKPIVLLAGEEVQMTISENEYIKLSDDAVGLELEKIS